MFQVADWSQRKLEIADAFRQAAPLLRRRILTFMQHSCMRSA